MLPELTPQLIALLLIGALAYFIMQSRHNAAPASGDGIVNVQPKSRKLERKMTFMGRSTILTDTETNPSYPMGVTFFKGTLKYDRLCALFTQRILEDPAFIRMHCRVAVDSVFQKVPIKIEDHIVEYDMSALVEGIDESEGPSDLSVDERKLLALVNVETTSHLDPAKPLWKLIVLQNYKGDNTVLITKMHHCMGDGTSFGLLFAKMCDAVQKGSSLKLDVSPPHKPSTERRDVLHKLMLQAWGLILYTLYWVVGFIAFHIKYLKTYMRKEPLTILKNELTGTRKVAWTRPLRVDYVKAAGKAFGGTVNDVALAAIAGALRRYLKEAGTPDDMMQNALRSAVPVNIREPADYKASEALRNLFGFVVVTSPIHLNDPVKRLQSVADTMRKIKRSPEGKLSSALAYSLSNVPKSILQKSMAFNTSYYSFVCTNVAGPQEALYVDGVAIDFGLGLVPPPPAIGLGFAIWSYYGDLRVTITTDTGVEIDPWKLGDLFVEEIELLSKAAAERVASRTQSAGEESKKAQ